MKTLLCMVLAMLMTSTMAQRENRVSLNSLINKTDNLIYLLDDNSHLLRGRRNKEKRVAIDKILDMMTEKMEQIINQGGGHSVALPSSFYSKLGKICRHTGTWTGDRNCYINGLKSETNVIAQVVMACSSISGAQDSSNCFHKALQMAANNDNEYSIISTSCRHTGTWTGDRACYDAATSVLAGDLAMNVIAGGCSSISGAQDSSNCFHKALASVKSDMDIDLKDVAKTMCRHTGTWTGDLACYKGSLEPLRNEDVGVRLLLNSCSSIRGAQDSSNCFHKGLQ